VSVGMFMMLWDSAFLPVT